jgi:hypothetical protein
VRTRLGIALLAAVALVASVAAVAGASYFAVEGYYQKEPCCKQPGFFVDLFVKRQHVTFSRFEGDLHCRDPDGTPRPNVLPLIVRFKRDVPIDRATGRFQNRTSFHREVQHWPNIGDSAKGFFVAKEKGVVHPRKRVTGYIDVRFKTRDKQGDPVTCTVGSEDHPWGRFVARWKAPKRASR